MGRKYDGKVTISTAIDNSGVEKDVKEISGEFGGLKKVLNDISKAISGAMSKPVSQACAKIKKDIDAATRKVEQYQKQIQKAESAKMPLVEQAERLGVELDEAKAKLAALQTQQQAVGAVLAGDGDAGAYIDAYAQKPQIDADVAQQQAKVDALQKQWDAVNDKVDGYNSKIDQANKEMAAQKSIVSGLEKKLDAAEKETKQMRKNASSSKKEFGAMGKAVDSFTSRLKSIALGALLFNGISAGLREFTSYMSKTLKTNEAFTTEISRLKGALLTAFQPIYNAVAPAVIYLIRLLTGATLAVAEFFASITGTTVEASAEAAKGLYEEVNALEEVEKTAKKAGKTLAGFDELNVLQNKEESSGTSGSSDAVKPDFAIGEWDTSELEKIKDEFKEIAKYIGVAAAGLVGFKLGNFIADLLTSEKKVKSLKTQLKQLGKKAGLVIGITLAITGIALETKGIVDAVKNGLNENSILDILGGGAMIASGGAMIGKFFGKGVLGGAVGAIVAGIPAYITGIYDACMNGLNWINGALIAAGSTAAGAGIGAIVGSLGGPITAGIGALIGLAGGLITDGILLLCENQIEPSLDILTEAEREFMAAADLAAQSFRDQQDATEKSKDGIIKQMDYVHELAGELQGLADANGRVQEKDEGRVKFILGELSKATGEEWRLVEGTIQRYDTLKDSIDKAIESKKAQLLLQASEGDFTKAIMEKDAAYDNLILKERDYSAQQDSLMEKEKKYASEIERLEMQINLSRDLGNFAAEAIYTSQLGRIQDELRAERDAVATKKEEWKKASLAYQNYSNTIINYEDAMAASLSGNYEEAVEILGRKADTFGNYAKAVDAETAKVLDALAFECMEAEREARRTKEKFEYGVAGYTEGMIDEAEEGYSAALNAFSNAYADSQKVGEDMGDGLSQGMESKRESLMDKAKGLIKSIMGAFRKEADSHSPSRKTIDLGEDIGIGPAIGIENMTADVVKAAEDQTDAVLDAYRGQADSAETAYEETFSIWQSFSRNAADIGKSFGGSFADGIYGSVKSIAAAGSVAAKAAMSALNGAQASFVIPSWKVTTPQIPHLAKGAVLPQNKPFMAVLGDQKHGTNIEAPLSTIQEAVALVMNDQTQAILAGFEASVGVQREILEAVLGIQIGDDVIGNAVARYSRKQAVMRGGAL